jgi:hypothetical protein
VFETNVFKLSLQHNIRKNGLRETFQKLNNQAFRGDPVQTLNEEDDEICFFCLKLE